MFCKELSAYAYQYILYSYVWLTEYVEMAQICLSGNIIANDRKKFFKLLVVNILCDVSNVLKMMYMFL